MILKDILKKIVEYIRFKWLILGFRIAGASDKQVNLEKGKYYLNKGTGYQVGQPITIKKPNQKAKKRYVKTLMYNFDSNSVNATFSDKPIKGKTEKFEGKKPATKRYYKYGHA